MNAYGVDVFHTADCDCVVLRVTHNLKLDFLVALNALFDKNLMHGRKLEGVDTDINKLLLVVGKTAACAAQCKGRT